MRACYAAAARPSREKAVSRSAPSLFAFPPGRILKCAPSAESGSDRTRTAAVNQHRAFLQAIRESPADDATRLVYADFLAENGDEDRAELIRVQCELSAGVRDRGRSLVLLRRLRALILAHRPEWAGVLDRLAPAAVFERGFIEAVQLRARQFLENAAAVMDHHPVSRLVLTHAGEATRELAE